MTRFFSFPYDHGRKDESVNDYIANANESEASAFCNYLIHDDNKYRYQKGKSDNLFGVNLYEKKGCYNPKLGMIFMCTPKLSWMYLKCRPI